MNDFFSNFFPISSNGFVYFERAEDESYSLNSSDESVGYDEDSNQHGLYD
jgi:hypothetical protein